MNATRRSLFGLLALLAAGPVFPRLEEPPSGGVRATLPATAPRDGAHDFDFHVGTWKTHVKRRLRPLTGSSEWAEYDGTTVVRKVWNGKANLVELEADGPKGRLELLSLRLYDPESRQWSLN